MEKNILKKRKNPNLFGTSNVVIFKKIIFKIKIGYSK
jgi:hypothetical protein